MANMQLQLFGLIIVLCYVATQSQVSGSQSVVYRKVNITMLRPPVLLTDKGSAARHLEKPLGPVLTKNDLEGHNMNNLFGALARPTCILHCKYGREVDMEGRALCKCRLAPCKRIKCPQGMKCLVKKFCQYGVCDDKPYCQVENTCKLAKPSNFYFGCAKLTKRFYFDTKKGKCRRFWGCKEIEGNNFSNKRECKRTCYKKRRPNKRLDSRRLASKKLSNAIPTPTRKQVPRPMSSKKIFSNTIPFQPIQLLRPREREAPRLFRQNCPSSQPYRKCPYNPCANCRNSQIRCYKSVCGYCQAIFLNIKTKRTASSCEPSRH